MNGQFNFDKKEVVGKFLSIIIGDSLIAASIVFFLKPNLMVSSGVNGIAIMIEYLFGLPLGLLIFLLNVPLMFLSIKFLDKEFSIFTVFSIFISSVAVSLFESLAPKGFAVTNEIMLAAIYGGIVKGLGVGILFKNNASSGGFDILAAIFKKKYNIAIGEVLLLVNFFIIGASAFIYTPDKAMYTLISLALSFKIGDIIQTKVGRQKQVFIISEKNEEIAHLIQEKVARGITYLDGEGGYENKDVKVIYLICTSRELIQVKKLVEREDKKAFIAISDTAEISGRGFEKIAI